MHSIYTKGTVKTSCCAGNEASSHQICRCSKKSASMCKTACDEDEHCSTYVIEADGNCLLSTTSVCPIDCINYELHDIEESHPYLTCETSNRACLTPCKKGLPCGNSFIKQVGK